MPYYDLGNYWIDAYLIGHMSLKYNRILLIRDGKEIIKEDPDISPLPYDNVMALINEGYEDLKSLIKDVKSKAVSKSDKLRSLEAILLPLYNPSQYLLRREDEMVTLNILKLLDKLYMELIKKMPPKPQDVGSIRLSLVNNKVLVNGKPDKILTNLYDIDDEFREIINNIFLSRVPSTY